MSCSESVETTCYNTSKYLERERYFKDKIFRKRKDSIGTYEGPYTTYDEYMEEVKNYLTESEYDEYCKMHKYGKYADCMVVLDKKFDSKTSKT